MVLERVLKSVVQVACVVLPAVIFFFLIIGVYGLRAAIGGLIIFIALALWIIRGTAEERPFPMSSGNQTRDFCAVQDIAEAICLILEEGTLPGHDVFNLGSGKSISLRGIVGSVCRQLGLNVTLEMGALPFHPKEPMNLVADIHLAESLGWSPRTNLAYAVWQLARSQFPDLNVTRPAQHIKERM